LKTEIKNLVNIRFEELANAEELGNKTKATWTKLAKKLSIGHSRHST